MSVTNRPAGCLSRPLPLPRISKPLVTAETSFAQMVQQTPQTLVTLPKAFAKNFAFPEQVPAAPQGKGSRPNYIDLLQAYVTYHPWKSITAFMKAEPDGTIKASIRQARQVYLVQTGGNPIILLCDVVEPPQETSYTKSNAAVGAAAKLIDANGKEREVGTMDITVDSQYRLWHYRVSDKHQEWLTNIVREHNLQVVVCKRSQEFRDGAMCATVPIWEKLCAEYDKICDARKEPPTLTYGERKDFMDDGLAHLQATVSGKYSTGLEPAARRAQQLKLAAQVCKLGGTVMLNGAVTRIQANDTKLLATIVRELRKQTERSDIFFPVRTDLPMKVPESMEAEETEETEHPTQPPPQGYAYAVLSYPEAMPQEVWSIVMNDAKLQPAQTTTKSKSKTFVYAPLGTRSQNISHSFGTFYLNADLMNPHPQSPNESPQSQSQLVASQRPV